MHYLCQVYFHLGGGNVKKIATSEVDKVDKGGNPIVVLIYVREVLEFVVAAADVLFRKRLQPVETEILDIE